MLKKAAKRLFGRLLGEDTAAFRILGAIYHLPRDRKPFLRHVLRRTEFLAEEELADAALLPEALLQNVMRELRPKSVLDVGCGVGCSLDWFLERGIDAIGLEGSRLAISKARNPGKILHRNLEKRIDLGKTFDLVWCFEVAEHIRPEYVESLVSTLTRHADRIVMSAAHPGQGGYGHFNEQPRSYWINLLFSFGYQHNDALCLRIIDGWTWNPGNIFVFEKK